MTLKSPSLGMTLLLASMTAIAPLAIDMYLPAMPTMAENMDAHISQVQQSLSIFLVSYGIGMLVFGPLADSFGRRPLALGGLLFFAIASLILTQVESIEAFLAWRAVQAFAGAATTVVVPGIIRHLYQENTAKGMSYVALIMMLAPLLAPAIGSAVLLVSHWHGIFWLSAAYALVIGICCWRSMPEIAPAESPRKFNYIASYSRIFSKKPARPLIVTLMFSSLATFAFVTSASFIYIAFYGVNEQMFALMFASNIVLIMLANVINSRLVSRFGPARMATFGMVTGVMSAIALIIISALELGPWPTVLCLAPLMASFSLISINTEAMIIMGFPQDSGTAAAVNGTLRFSAGASAGPLLAYFFNGTPMPTALLMATGIIGIILCRVWTLRQKNTEPSTQ